MSVSASTRTRGRGGSLSSHSSRSPSSSARPSRFQAIYDEVLTSTLYETLVLISENPEAFNGVEGKQLWRDKIASERHGSVPTEAETNPLAYYLTHTRNVGAYLTEWYEYLVRHNTKGKGKVVSSVASAIEPKLSYSYGIRIAAGGEYGAWAVNLAGGVIHRDITDPYTHWTRVTIPTIALDVSCDESGHNAVVLCEDSVIYVLRARGKVILGPYATGLGSPVVEVRMSSRSETPEYNASLTVQILLARGGIYGIEYQHLRSQVGWSLVDPYDAFQTPRHDVEAVAGIPSALLESELANLDGHKLADDLLHRVDYYDYRGGVSEGYAEDKEGALSFVKLALGPLREEDAAQAGDLEYPQSSPLSASGEISGRLVGASPYHPGWSTTRDTPAPLVSGGPIEHSKDDVDDMLTEMQQHINEEADLYEDATGEDFTPDWGLNGYRESD